MAIYDVLEGTRCVCTMGTEKGYMSETTGAETVDISETTGTETLDM